MVANQNIFLDLFDDYQKRRFELIGRSYNCYLAMENAQDVRFKNLWKVKLLEIRSMIAELTGPDPKDYGL